MLEHAWLQQGWNRGGRFGVQVKVKMKRRWSNILPIAGLLLFGWFTHQAYEREKAVRIQMRYLYWGSLLLDRHPLTPVPPKVGLAWDPKFISVHRDYLFLLLQGTAFPCFLMVDVLMSGLGRLGASHVVTFFISMPLLLAAWYYFIGWAIDRRRHRRELRCAASPDAVSDGRATSG